jgi:hypothetical protein
MSSHLSETSPLLQSMVTNDGTDERSAWPRENVFLEMGLKWMPIPALIDFFNLVC